jgi:hypothetical protein
MSPNVVYTCLTTSWTRSGRPARTPGAIDEGEQAQPGAIVGQDADGPGHRELLVGTVGQPELVGSAASKRMKEDSGHLCGSAVIRLWRPRMRQMVATEGSAWQA